ncbi:MAG TPA: rhodanese-like domain-containing protein [Pyrinomonadaceae bacterium]|nr:rhodanese-like domain-containing protein [Pyrinomonadaceae bacterium]
MRFILTTLIVAAFAVAGLTACQNASTTTTQQNNSAKTTAEKPKNDAPKTDEHGHADDAPRISLADAKKDFDAGKVVFIDTRAEATYKQEHIKGAINIPMEAVDARYKEIPTGKKIIAYCS